MELEQAGDVLDVVVAEEDGFDMRKLFGELVDGVDAFVDCGDFEFFEVGRVGVEEIF